MKRGSCLLIMGCMLAGVLLAGCAALQSEPISKDEVIVEVTEPSDAPADTLLYHTIYGAVGDVYEDGFALVTEDGDVYEVTTENIRNTYVEFESDASVALVYFGPDVVNGCVLYALPYTEDLTFYSVTGKILVEDWSMFSLESDDGYDSYFLKTEIDSVNEALEKGEGTHVAISYIKWAGNNLPVGVTLVD